jgi:integrase
VVRLARGGRLAEGRHVPLSAPFLRDHPDEQRRRAQDVQKALRHANLRITLETYVHWLPKKDRPRGVVGGILRKAAESRQAAGASGQDQS